MAVPDVLQKLLDAAHPYSANPPWDFAPADVDARQKGSAPGCMLRSLRRICSPAELCETQVAVMASAGHLALSPKLARPGVSLLGLRDESGELYDVLTEQGLLVGREPSAVAMLRDHKTSLALQATERIVESVFLTTDLAELVLLRSLGLPAALCDGLLNPTKAGIEAVCNHFAIEAFWQQESVPAGTKDQEVPDWSGPPPWARGAADHVANFATPSDAEPASEGDDSPTPRLPQLIIVAWRLRQLSLDLPEGFPRLMESLRQLERLLDLCLDQVQIWQPSPELLIRLRYAMERREPDWVQNALLRSLEDDLCDFTLWGQPPATVREINNLADASRWLTQLSTKSGSDSRDDFKQAIDTYYLLVESKLVDPLLRSAEATTDPRARGLEAAFALLVRLYHHRLPELTQKLSDCTDPQRALLYIQELTALGKQVFIFAKELRK